MGVRFVRGVKSAEGGREMREVVCVVKEVVGEGRGRWMVRRWVRWSSAQAGTVEAVLAFGVGEGQSRDVGEGGPFVVGGGEAIAERTGRKKSKRERERERERKKHDKTPPHVGFSKK